MTEAIEILKEVNANYFQPDKEGEFDDVNKALDVAIQAIEEAEQYRALGTVEELKEARGKQIAKKPLADSHGERGMGFLIPICPNCRESVEEGEHHCKCGQALKWGEEDD